MKTIKDLKQMMREPASKEWFVKHGMAKHKALKREIPETAKARNEAMNRKYGIPRETGRDRYIDSNPREHYNK